MNSWMNQEVDEVSIFRKLLIIALVPLVLVLSGCEPKVYYFNFVDEQSLTNEEGSWFVDTPGDHEFTIHGLLMNGTVLCAPHKYSGDFAIILEFLLDVSSDPGAGAPTIALFLTPDRSLAPGEGDNQITIAFQSINALHNMGILEEGPEGDDGLVLSHSIPGLDATGSNILKITKTGDELDFDLNGTTLWNHALEYYESKWFCPFIMALTPFETAWIVSMQIEYKGMRSEN